MKGDLVCTILIAFCTVANVYVVLSRWGRKDLAFKSFSTLAFQYEQRSLLTATTIQLSRVMTTQNTSLSWTGLSFLRERPHSKSTPTSFPSRARTQRRSGSPSIRRATASCAWAPTPPARGYCASRCSTSCTVSRRCASSLTIRTTRTSGLRTSSIA